MRIELFRAQPLEARAASKWGRPVSLVPIAWSRITALIVLLIAAIACFVATAEFARKETVRGRLRPQTAEARVFPSDPGIVALLRVGLGDTVQKDDPLIEISTSRQLDGFTSVAQASLRSLHEQLESVETRRTSLAASATLATERYGIDLTIALSEQESLIGAVDLWDQRLRLARERLAAAERLEIEGAASQEEVRARQEALIAVQQQRLDTIARLENARSRSLAADVQLRSVREEAARNQADINEELARLSLQTTQIRAAERYVINSPIAGQVAALQVKQGEMVHPAVPVLTIIPASQSLIADAYITSRAIAFVESGQRVRLMIDAFPYQKFGTLAGTVVSVSQTTLPPQAIAEFATVKEPVYQVSIHLDRQQIDAFGKSTPLQSGMEFSADIILEDRKLIEWLLEPFYAASTRMGGKP
jgi:membrane fusion protein